MPNNMRSTRIEGSYRVCVAVCGLRFQLPRRNALATAAKLTGIVNRHEFHCERCKALKETRCDTCDA